MPERLSSLFARRARPVPPPPPPDDVVTDEPAAPGEEMPPPAGLPPGPVEMRRERRALAFRREIEMRDVGGLAVEMVRRDRFTPDLLIQRANDVLLLEQRMHELDSRLAVEIAVRGLHDLPHCRCGAPLPPGVHFCSHCGRPSTAAPPILACTHCGQPLPADTNFCSFCGHPVAAEEYLADTASRGPEETLVRPAPEVRPPKE
jgi:hypothetical protein